MLLADYPISNWRDACTVNGLREAHDEQIKRVQMDGQRETKPVSALEGIRPIMPQQRIVSVLPGKPAPQLETKDGVGITLGLAIPYEH